MRFSQTHRAVLRAAIAVIVMFAVALSAGFASAATTSPRGTIGANADFTGTWTQTDGGGTWTVTQQSADGTCAGVTYYGTGYEFANCKVTGNNYVFDITDGAYVSHNSGTITDNTVNGGFSDNNGTTAKYTATRTSGGERAVNVSVVCDTPPNPAQFGSCSAIVADASGQSPLETPTGSVKLTAATGSLFGSQCNLTASASAPSAPSCSLLYQPPAGGLPAGEAVPVTASYAGDSNFGSGSGGAKLFAASLSDDDGDALGICEGTTGDCTGYDESTPADTPETDTSLSFTSDCSGASEDADARTATELPADDPGTCTVDGTATTAPSADAKSAILADQKLLDQNIKQMMSDEQKAGEPQQKLIDDAAKINQIVQDETTRKAAASDKAFNYMDAYIRGDEVFRGSDADRAEIASASTKATQSGFLGALEAVLLDHPTSADVKAFNALIATAVTSKNAAANELARYEVGLIDSLGYSRLVVELHGKHGKLPSTITLGKVHSTIASGKQKKLSITLSTIDQRLLRVLSTLPKQSSVTLKTTLTRPHVKKRAGTAKLRIATP